jgi:hypothetical protein
VLFRSDLRGSGDARDIPYNAMLIGAADAHIELQLATLDDAARAILAALRTVAREHRPPPAASSSVA